MYKVGYIVTTFMRDDLLFKSVLSCPAHAPVIIVDQQPSDHKRRVSVFYVEVPLNSGLSYSRNAGVKKAVELGCDYVVLMADSIAVAADFSELVPIIDRMVEQKYDIVGLPLLSRIGWEAKMDLIAGKCFLLDFIKRQKSNDLIIQECDICRNFFVAKTSALVSVPWDEQFKMREHEDFFWRCKEAKLKVGFTNKYPGQYIGTKEDRYTRQRTANMEEGLALLQKKYGISGWVSYQNIQNAKET